VRVARTLADSAVVNRWLGALSKRGAILAYHGVVPEGALSSPLHVTAAGLAAQLDTLVSLGSRFIPLEEMLGRLRTARSVDKCVSVTFDDAYAGLDLALPVLQRVKAPATVFVPTGSLGGDDGFWWDRLDAIASALASKDLTEWARSACRRAVPAGLEVEHVRAHIMSRGAGRLEGAMLEAFQRVERGHRPPPELLCMDQPALVRWARWDGATFAPHTVTHAALPLLAAEEQQREIAASYQRLRERVDAIPVIAYPYGLYDGRTLRAAHDAGMTGGVTMDRVGCAPGECSPFRVPRLPFGGATPVRRMGLFLSGAWRWYRRRDWRDGYPKVPGVTDTPSPGSSAAARNPAAS